MVRRLFVLAVLALGFIGPATGPEPRMSLRWVDRDGVDQRCPETRARLVAPPRDSIHAFVLFEDFAYAAAEGRFGGACFLVALLALPITLFGLWCSGFGCALRRLYVTVMLGLPLAGALLYGSCFLPGRTIRLGPDAVDMVMANLNTKTIYSTGVLTPRQLRNWHAAHGVAVLNVADRGQVEGARRVARYNFEEPDAPAMTVTIGMEWHGHPNLITVNSDRLWGQAGEKRADVIAEVRRHGGATFIAQPWLRLDEPLATALERGADGVEYVNSAYRAGQSVIDAATEANPPRALIGVSNPRFVGPHLNAITLLPRSAAASPRRVAAALRSGLTEVLYSVGSAMSTLERDSNPLEEAGILPALRTLGATSRARRAIWFLTIAFVMALWWLSVRSVKKPRLSRTVTRVIFWTSGVLVWLPVGGVLWQVRAFIGPIPIPILLSVSVPFAMVLLATSHHMWLYGQTAGDFSE